MYSYIQAPQDDKIEELNRRLNNTYIAYGSQGSIKLELQSQQDTNASSLNRGILLQRAKVKSSENYSNTQWDLVDAFAEGTVGLENVKTEELPDIMRSMNEREREAYVKQKMQERKEIQQEIIHLSNERDEYLKTRRMETVEESTLDLAIMAALKDIASQKGFVFDE